MADYYEAATADTALKCTAEEAEKLKSLLEEHIDDDLPWHGFASEYLPDGSGEFYLFAESSANLEVLPKPFLVELGKIIKANGLNYLQIGVAITCSRLRPDSHGGYYVRIYPDGELDFADLVWPKEKKNN